MGMVLEAKELTKSYQSGKQNIEVLKKIDTIFEKGLFYAITGRSGSGKSTLLHALFGLEKPDTGSSLMNGRRLETRMLLKEVTEHLGIEKLLKKYPDVLSGGEQQKVAIARFEW